MVTLIVLGYIVISLFFSISNMRDRYNSFGELIKAQKPKDAFKEGFLTLPILGLIGVIFVGVFMLFGAILISSLVGGVWIFNNMP